MKAKEYAQEVIDGFDAFFDENNEPNEQELFSHVVKIMQKIGHDFIIESKGIIENRRVSTDKGLFAVFREQNQKFNAVRRILNKHYGYEIIKQNAFKIIIENEWPDIAAYIPKSTWY